MIPKTLMTTLTLASLLGCGSEQNFHDDMKPWGEPNPLHLQDTRQTDRHVQVPPSAVDALFVIDNSCSMDKEQALLADNFDKFINYFIDSETDWHVGVVSTDMVSSSQSGQLVSANGVRFVDSSTPDPIDTFQKMAILGTNGDMWAESGRAAAYTAVELLRNEYNSGFYREDATLAVIHISDEEDQSGSSPISLNEYIHWLSNIKYRPEDVSVSSIVTPEGGCPTGYSEGLDYLEVTRAFNGVEASICDSDWSYVMDEIGLLAAGARTEFFLSQLPASNSIAVSVIDEGEIERFDEGDCASCYHYDERRNSIKFTSYIPNEYAEVVINYTLLSNSYGGDSQTSSP